MSSELNCQVPKYISGECAGPLHKYCRKSNNDETIRYFCEAHNGHMQDPEYKKIGWEEVPLEEGIEIEV